MLENVDVKLGIYVPSLQDLASTTPKARISSDEVEFDNVEFYDINGDPYFVVAATMDFDSATLSYRIVERFAGSFADVDDETGFNGYVFDFKLGKLDADVSLKSARIVGGLTTLDIEKAQVDVKGNALRIDVDGLRYESGDTLAVRLGFKIEGDRRENWLEGAEGDDVILAGSGRDVLLGAAGKDTLKGGAGADLISGGPGRDKLFGQPGGDDFVLEFNGGTDKVMDFDADDDRIRIYTGAREFEDLSLSREKGYIDVESGGAHLWLMDTKMAEVTEDLFVF